MNLVYYWAQQTNFLSATPCISMKSVNLKSMIIIAKLLQNLEEKYQNVFMFCFNKFKNSVKIYTEIQIDAVEVNWP